MIMSQGEGAQNTFNIIKRILLSTDVINVQERKRNAVLKYVNSAFFFFLNDLWVLKGVERIDAQHR